MLRLNGDKPCLLFTSTELLAAATQRHSYERVVSRTCSTSTLSSFSIM